MIATTKIGCATLTYDGVTLRIQPYDFLLEEDEIRTLTKTLTRWLRLDPKDRIKALSDKSDSYLLIQQGDLFALLGDNVPWFSTDRAEEFLAWFKEVSQ